MSSQSSVEESDSPFKSTHEAYLAAAARFKASPEYANGTEEQKTAFAADLERHTLSSLSIGNLPAILLQMSDWNKKRFD
jgi:hypothetical protein